MTPRTAALRDLAGLAPEAVLPEYGGGSLANLPPTIGHVLGVDDGWGAPPLAPPLTGQLGRAERVILLLLDGLGLHRLEGAESAAGGTPFAGAGSREILRTRLTSVVPSTTTVATTVLLGNGSGPAATGVLGYTMLLPRLGLLANMLRWRVASAPGAAPGFDLEALGARPEEFVRAPNLAEVLARAGVEMHAFLPGKLVDTPLSRMQMQGARLHGYINDLDLWSLLRGWHEAEESRFAYAYLSDFDTISHRDGPHVPLWDALLGRVSAELTALTGELASRGSGRTLLLITADHGHVASPLHARTYLQDLPELTGLLALPPGGEARHVNLYARGGAGGELLAFCRERLAGRFSVLDGSEALAAGLYGPPEGAHPEAAARVGDVLLLARGPNHLWDRDAQGRMLGMHGSLDGEEMLVPLVAIEM